jgi:hypothetical protein
MEVRFHKNFKKRFNRIPLKVQEQFLQRLDFFMSDTFDEPDPALKCMVSGRVL